MNALEAVWEQPVTQALGGALAGFVWQGVAVALGVRAILARMERRPARERYAVACLGLLLMAALPVGSFVSALAGAASEPSTVSAGLEDVLTGATEAVLGTRVGVWLEELRPWLLSAWLCGVLFLSLRTAGAWRQTQALAEEGTRPPGALVSRALARVLERTGVTVPVRLRVSTAIGVPRVVGWWRPLILVPTSALAGLSVLQLEAILAHEVAHIRRYDVLVNQLQALVEAALFYHPAVWWLSARIREEREHCADEVAVESCGDALFYSRAMTTLEQLRMRTPALTVAASGRPLLPRFQRLLAAPADGAPPPLWRLAGSLGVASLVVLLGAARPAQATEAPAEPRVPHASAPGTSAEEVLPFQEGMTRPRRISGDMPEISESMWPPEAASGLLPREYVLDTECTLSAEGRVTACAPLMHQPELAKLEAETLRALRTSRYEPVTYQGRPIAVRYVFRLIVRTPSLGG
jgi:beta-lactamase regulating signal transducer with metallopeptidase domain